MLHQSDRPHRVPRLERISGADRTDPDLPHKAIDRTAEEALTHARDRAMATPRQPFCIASHTLAGYLTGPVYPAPCVLSLWVFKWNCF
jgi:hypothetical protein